MFPSLSPQDLPRGLGPSMFKNRNMIEAIEKYKAPKSRPANWLLMFVEKIYKVRKAIRATVAAPPADDLLRPCGRQSTSKILRALVMGKPS